MGGTPWVRGVGRVVGPSGGSSRQGDLVNHVRRRRTGHVHDGNDLAPAVNRVGLSLDANDAFRNGPNNWNSYQAKIGSSQGSVVRSGVGEVFDMSRGIGFGTASKVAPGVGLVMTGYASYEEAEGDWGKTAAYWGVDLAAIGAGAAAGAAIGSVIPGAGTLVGGLIGAVFVGAAGFVTSEIISSYGHDRINENWGRPMREWEMW